MPARLPQHEEKYGSEDHHGLNTTRHFWRGFVAVVP